MHCTLLLDTSIIDVGIESGSQDYVSIVLHSFQSMLIESGKVLRLVYVINLILILSRPFTIRGRAQGIKINKQTSKQTKRQTDKQTKKQTKTDVVWHLQIDFFSNLA